ncbi:MAG TPA: TldD/PmbA family protein, partial [Solirubrobacterales bacterium]|nr:TldD/PmbA family protein [Solirubrobacterales bacterium]
MSAELEQAARRTVEAATAGGASEAEAWAEGSRSREVRVHDGDVESLTEASGRGVGVRAWIGTRTGYAYGTDLSEAGLAELGEAAVGAARVADEDESSAAPEPAGEQASPIEGLRDDGVARTGTAEVIDLAKEVERVALGRDDRVTSVEEVVYVDEDTDAAIATSRGVSGTYGASVAYSFLQAMATQDGEVQTGLGFGVGRSPGQLDAKAIGADAGDEAASMLGATKPQSRSCPVVLSDRVTASFVGFIGGALCADEVQRGRSPFADRLGDELASRALVLADDGTDPGGLASAPFDGEGTPRGRTPLVAEGKLLAYLHDSYTARRGGATSTGNASRSSYRSPPSVSPSNLMLEPGELTLEQLIAEAADGVYITEVAGLHSGVNPVTGRYSIGATGRAIHDGALGEPLREFTIAGDLLGTLAAVQAVGSETRWVPFGGSVKTAPMLVGEMAIGG